MTRINCVPPSELTVKHLVAEYRELPRVFRLAERYVAGGGDFDALPASYRLGKGHVRFFYNKLGWLADRQRDIVAEMIARGYRPQFTGDLRREWRGMIPRRWWGSWDPDDASIAASRARIAERLRS